MTTAPLWSNPSPWYRQVMDGDNSTSTPRSKTETSPFWVAPSPTLHHRQDEVALLGRAIALSQRGGTPPPPPEAPAAAPAPLPPAPTPAPLDDGIAHGEAGRSSLRIFAERTAARKEGLRKVPLGRFLHLFSSEPSTTMLWHNKGKGEKMVGAVLHKATAKGAIVLHDRGLGTANLNIDHVVIAPSGIHVIETCYRLTPGHVSMKRAPSLSLGRGPLHLVIGGDDATELVSHAELMTEAVRRCLGDSRWHSLSQTTHLCVIGGKFDFMTSQFPIGNVWIETVRALRRAVTRKGSLTQPEIVDIARHLSTLFPPA